MTEPLCEMSIGPVAEPARLAWAEGLKVSIPAQVASALVPCLESGDLRAAASGLDPDIVQRLRLRSAFTEQKPASSRLPVSYQIVPPRIRTLVGRLIGLYERRREDTWARFPKWPIDLSADFLSDLIDTDALPNPGDSLTPVWVSHDLDTAEGLRNLTGQFLEVEEAVGARSTNYIVPCDWPIDHGLLKEVHERGHEIGVHGYDHSNLTPFCEPRERRRRLSAAAELIERYDIRGYRAPSLVRTRALLDDLVDRYHYDSSIPTSGGRFPVPNNGCATARPFAICGILELPLSLPRDGSLRFLGYGPESILDTWKRCADLIRRSRGSVGLLTHCEARFSGNPVMLDIYRRFLEHLKYDGRYRFTTANALVSDTRNSQL